VERPGYWGRISAAFETHAVVAILGPRQCGKTTLGRRFSRQFPGSVTSFDLEDPGDLARLQDPKLALEDLRGLVVIDEIQRAPGLFTVLRVLVDREPSPARFLILGSASRDLIRQSAESLAGRISYIELTPFHAGEVAAEDLTTLWVRGGFPRSFLAGSNAASMGWRRSFISTFLERDIPNLGIRIPPPALRRLWMMLVHSHGQALNASELGRSLGIADTTVRRYLDILAGTYMIRQLPPWHENISKRQVKSPKIYFRDSGILHAFLGLESHEAMLAHPKLGASWEGFALEQVILAAGAEEGETFFWSSQGKAELDLLLVQGDRKTGYEIKYTSRPADTRSMRAARQDLKLSRLEVIYPGRQDFPIAEGVRAAGLGGLVKRPV